MRGNSADAAVTIAGFPFDPAAPCRNSFPPPSWRPCSSWQKS